MEAAKKKRAMLAVVCVALVALIAAAGTVAYLQAESEDVVNTFDTNQVKVDLKETTGYDYNIVPGTSETKDPKVTVTATVDSYVFVEVTDSANKGDTKVIEYSLENGWIPLEGYDSVYYREVSANDQAQEFYVLAGNKVSYPPTLTNADMPTSGVTLTFKASAIQKDPFNDPVLAYKMDAPAEVTNLEEFAEALENGGGVELASNITVPASSIPGDAPVAIDLHGNTLTINDGNSGIVVTSDMVISGEDGSKLVWDADSSTAFALKSEGSLTLDNVDFTTNATINVEKGSDPVTLNVKNSTINSSDYYCISTNAGVSTSGKTVAINIENSTLTAVETHDNSNDSAGILFNIPGTLNVDTSTITGDRQAVIVRCGTASIANSTLNCTGAYSGSVNYDSSQWGDGNEVPVATLVVGNRSSASAYPYDAACTLDNVTLELGSNLDRALVYAAAYNGHTTMVNATGTTDSSYTYTTDQGENSTVTVSGLTTAK